jgi:hypothetical protein
VTAPNPVEELIRRMFAGRRPDPPQRPREELTGLARVIADKRAELADKGLL